MTVAMGEWVPEGPGEPATASAKRADGRASGRRACARSVEAQTGTQLIMSHSSSRRQRRPRARQDRRRCCRTRLPLRWVVRQAPTGPGPARCATGGLRLFRRPPRSRGLMAAATGRIMPACLARGEAAEVALVAGAAAGDMRAAGRTGWAAPETVLLPCCPGPVWRRVRVLSATRRVQAVLVRPRQGLLLRVRPIWATLRAVALCPGGWRPRGPLGSARVAATAAITAGVGIADGIGAGMAVEATSAWGTGQAGVSNGANAETSQPVSRVRGEGQVKQQVGGI